MALVKFNPNNGVNRWNGFTGLFDNFFGRDISDYLHDQKGTVPSVNIAENNEAYKVEVAVPGMSRNDFDVKVENDMLVITGNKEEKHEDNSDKYTRKEFHYSTFRRAFHLPDTVDIDKIKAKYSEGILFLNIPKKEETKDSAAKTIKIS